MVKKLFSTVFATTALIDASAVHSLGQEFVSHLHAFDRAQEELNFEEVVPYLASDASIEIITCDGSVENLDINKFKQTYNSIQNNADLLAIKREVKKLDECSNGSTCIVHSEMKERVVAFSGRYDQTTVSKEVAKLVRKGEEVNIRSIQADIACE